MINMFHKVYFADFYCYNDQHYVTLVIAHQDTWEDHFCTKNLLLIGLNPDTNQFFFWDPVNGGFFCSSSVRVEILYTQDVNVVPAFAMTHGGSYSTVETFGRKWSSSKGMKKNPKCKQCNLYVDDL